MIKNVTRVLAWMALCLCTVGAHAASTPEQLVREYMGALQTEGMTAASRYIHPDELARFKQMLMPVLLADLASTKPQIVPAVYGGNMTAEKMEAMPDADLMNGLMKALGDQLAELRFEAVDVLGSVKEGEQTHVVTRVRIQMEALRLAKMEVVSVKPYKDSWKLMLSGELEGIAAALSKQK